MSLDDYLEQSGTEQKETHITMSNPDHPDNTASYADHKVMKKHFDAAIAIQNSSIDRKMIVGEFLSAVEMDLGTDSNENLVEFFNELTE